MTLRPLTLIGIILSIVSGMSVGVAVHLHLKELRVQELRAMGHSLPADTLSAALHEVSTHYIEEISEQELLGYAIKGMMEGLDEYSNYLDPPSFDSLQSMTNGRFGGIGIELGLVNGFFTVVSPIDGTPAQRAGLKANDIIVGVDGESVKGMKLKELIERLRGDPGSSVTLSIKRAEQANKDFALQRAIVRVTSVYSRILEPGIGYLRISQFQTSTGNDVEHKVTALLKEEGAPLQGLIIDLRNNPGGTLQSSVEVADHFLNSGLIVSTAGRVPSAAAKYRASKGDMLIGVPIVVLINSGSASASEIVAASLQDHKRATLMGSKSYGKGSVQTVVPLDDDQALKLTTAHYYTPNGRTIHNVGVDPDITFEGDEEAMLDEAVQLLRSKYSDQLQARLKQPRP